MSTIRTSDYFSNLKPPFVVVGLGVSGLASVELLKSLGVAAKDILTFDHKDPSADFSSPDLLMAKNPKTLFVSPGVPLSLDWLREARASGAEISSELSLAFSFLKSERVIAITGSIGKSTTTSLLGAAAHRLSLNNFVGGNLGTPLANYVVSLISGKQAAAEWVILELSSYQLENFDNLRCEFSAITYLTPNHLERYKTLDEYYNVKLGLIRKTEKLCVLNSRGGDLKEKISDGRWQAPLVWVDRSSELLNSKAVLPCSLVGKYNLDNLSVAVQIADRCNWSDSAFLAMKQFPGLPHRLENCGAHRGVQFINDSKATTIESVIQATETVLESVHSPSKLFLLLGGHDKNLPWGKLSFLKKYPQLNFLYFGEFGKGAQKQCGLPGPYYQKLSLSLAALPKLAGLGDSVLLSPGGTSHDEFNNFEERGDFFKSEIARLFKP